MMNTSTDKAVTGSGTAPSVIVTDGRTLRAMAKANKLTWPVPIHGGKQFKYVDEENRSRSFEWNGGKYRIDYVDGCFFPFVFKV